MALAFRWLLRIVVALSALALAGAAVGYWLASRSLPDYDARVDVEGLSDRVEIVRDTHNVPHVFGNTDADVVFGLGYAHAQDRLWQMTMLRRTVQGRLSELFGPRTLRIDELMRRLDLYGLASDSVAAQDEGTRALLNAYAAGVNARIAHVNAEALGRGALEFFLFDPVLAPWRPADSLAILKLMAFRLSPHLADEALRAQVALEVSPDRLRDLMPDAPGDAIAALPDFAALPGIGTGGGLHRAARLFDPLDPSPTRTRAGASNAWAAAPGRSAAGGSLLANDPHLGFNAPGIWYLARIELATGGVIGATIPGMPLVLSGRSPNLAWGLTSSYLDDQDVMIERLNPDNSGEYLVPDGWAPFETRRSVIDVRGRSPVTITLRRTENGPVLPPWYQDIGRVTAQGHVATLAWTALDDADTSMTAGMRLMRAGSVAEAMAAGALFVAPSQNLMLADRDGIAMQLIGRMPARAPGHQTLGRMPAPGWRAENRWQGSLPYTVNPRFENPRGGILGNTNNKMIDRAFPLHVSYLWGDTQRIRRWQTLMGDRQVQTRESFIEAQLDTVSFTARALLPLIARDLWFTGDPAPSGTSERRRQDALALLANWNGEMNEHLPEPLIFTAWLRALHGLLIRDDIGTLSDSFSHPDPVFIERVFRDIDGAGVWCDIRQTSPVETCPEISRRALDTALLGLAERYGGRVESWRWGDLHEARHDHPVLGDLALLGWLVNIRQSTSGGDNTLMRGVTAGEGDNPYANVHGAGYRGVYDFADPDSSVFIIATGQSGHPLSRHYDDLGGLWRRGEYIPMSLDPGLARAAALGVTVLEPR